MSLHFKLALSIFLLPGLSTSLHAQFFSQIKGFSTIVSNGIAVDDAGNVYITGGFIGSATLGDSTQSITLSSIGLKDVFVAKYNPQGRVVWGFSIGGIAGGPGVDDEGLAIAISSAGNVYVAGYFQGTADFDPGTGTAEKTSNGFRDAFLASFNSDGTFRWVKSFGGTADDRAHDVGTKDDEAVYLTGLFRETATLSSDATGANAVNSVGEEDGFLISLAPNASLNWIVSFGDTSVDKGNRVDTDSAGNVYLYGIFSRDVDFDPSPESDVLSSLNGSQDGVLASYLPDGTLNWAIPIGGAQLDGASGLAVSPDGNAFVTGDFIGAVNFNPTDEALEITSAGRDQYIAAYSSQGLLDWVNPLGTGFALGSDVAVNDEGIVHVTGFFSGDIFPDLQSTLRLASNGEQDMMLASYFINGDFRWAHAIGGALSEVPTGVAINGAGDAYLTGFFEDEVDFNPGTDTLLASSTGEYDGFVAQFRADGSLAVNVEEPPISFGGFQLDLFPNPTTNRITLSFTPNRTGIGTLEIMDVLGRLVKSVETRFVRDIKATMHIDVSGISAGTYFVRMKNEGASHSSFTILR